MSYAIGVLGDGEVSRRTLTALFNDWHTAHPIDVVYVSGHPEQFTLPCRYAVDWAEANGVDYGILMTEGQDVAHLEDYDLDAHSGIDPDQPSATLAVVENSDDVFLAWNPEEEDRYVRTAEQILALGKGCYDLVDGLYPITSDGSESDSPAPEATEPPGDTEGVETPQETTQPQEPTDEAQALDRAAVVDIIHEELHLLGLLP
jgi:hypothetical protein